MRIAMVNTDARRGGAARMAATLVNALADLKEDVCLYHAGDRQKTEHFCGLRRSGARQVNALLARVGGSFAIQDFGVAADILSRVQDADVLHVHNLHGYYLDYPKLLSAWKRRPIVWTWHDFWGVTGRCCLPNPDCGLWRNGCGDCPYLQVYPAAWLDWSAREFRRKGELYQELEKLLIVTPARWLANLAMERGFSPDRVQVIPNPVDISQYRPQPQAEARQKLGLPLDQPLLLFVAADCNDPRKGFGDFRRLVENTGIAAIAVGKPPREQTPSITLAGSVSDAAALSTYYSAADLLVMTTQADNYPNVIIEAMACGTPVISYNVGGISDQMPAFWDGVVPLSDRDALRVRCQEAIGDRTRLTGLRGAFREHAVSTWDPQVVGRQYLSAYRQAMSVQSCA